MHHSASNLSFMLLKGPVCLEVFRILEKRAVAWAPWSVTFFALGVSHAVALERDGVQLVEVLSCAPTRISGGQILSSSACADWEFRTKISGLLYECRLYPVELTDDMSSPSGLDPETQIEAFYPAEPGTITPVTRVIWQTEAGKLRVKTLHTYPGERKAIVSESLFTQELGTQ